MRVLVTGGHFSPAYSVVKRLIRQDYTVAIAGRRHVFEGDNVSSFEYTVARREGIPFYEIRTGRIQRRLTKFTITSALKIPRGIYDSINAILEFEPDVVLTFGGYISFPVSLASFLLGIPIILHEQTQKAGLAGRFIGPMAKKICISFKDSKKYFREDKVVLTGNPIRAEIYKVDKKIDIEEGLPVIYFTGGSSGSKFINSYVEVVINKLIAKFVVIHQAGDSRFFDNYKALEQIKKNLPEKIKKRYILRKFIYPEEIGFVLSKASLVVSRAGINTVMELLALGKMCLLVPLTSGQTNEQLDNALLVKGVGIGDYINEEISKEEFYYKIEDMIRNSHSYEKNASLAKALILKNADQKILEVLEDIYGKKGH